MIVSANGSDYKPVPAGSYVATCVRVIDQGTQTSNYQGQEKSARKLLITWEIPEVEMSDQNGDPKPALISSGYTASLHEKASLRAVLQSWRGRAFTADELKGFDLKNVLGAPCMVNVVHTEKDGNTYANVAAVMALPKGMPKPTPVHPLINFDLDAFEPEVFEALSPRLKEKISASPEYKAVTGAASDGFHGVGAGGVASGSAGDPYEDSVPF